MDKEYKILVGIAIAALLIFSGNMLFFQDDKPYDRSSAFTQSTDYSSPLSKLQSKYPTLYNQYKDMIGNTGSKGVDNIHITDNVVFSEDIYSANDGKVEIPVDIGWYYTKVDDFWSCKKQSNGLAEMASLTWKAEIIHQDGHKYAPKNEHHWTIKNNWPDYLSDCDFDLPWYNWDDMWMGLYGCPNFGSNKDESPSNRYGEHEYVALQNGYGCCVPEVYERNWAGTITDSHPEWIWDGTSSYSGTIELNFKKPTAFLFHVEIRGNYWDYHSEWWDPAVNSEKKEITIAEGYTFIVSDVPSSYVGDEKVDINIEVKNKDNMETIDEAKVRLSGEIDVEGTTSDGIIDFNDIPEGFYNINIRKGEFHIKEQEIKISVENTNFEYYLEPLAEKNDVTVNIISTSGFQVDGALVRLKPINNPDAYIEEYTDISGQAVFTQIREGRYEVVVKHPEFYSDSFALNSENIDRAIYEIVEIDNPPLIQKVKATPERIETGGKIRLSIDAYDPDLDEITGYRVDWGDTPYLKQKYNWEEYDSFDEITHTYEMTKEIWMKSFQPEEQFTISVQAKSKALYSEVAKKTITVYYVNKQPYVEKIIHQPVGYPGIRYSFEIKGKDPDNYPNDLQYRIIWGDGDISDWSSNSKFSHTYSKPGAYTIQAKVSDGQTESKWYTMKDSKYGVKEENFIVGHMRLEKPDITSLSIASPGKTSNAVITMKTMQDADDFDIYVYISGEEGVINSWRKVEKSYNGKEYLANIKFVCHEEGEVTVASKAMPSYEALEGYITSLVDTKRGECKPYYDKDSPYNKHDNPFREDEEEPSEPEQEYDPHRNMNEGNISDEANLYDESKNTEQLFPIFEIIVIILISAIPFILTVIWIANRRRRR